MVLRNPPSRVPPPGPSGPEPQCMLLPLVARMAVERPEGLAREPWASHLRGCAACYGEAAGLALSVAVFQAVEGGKLAPQESALTWESFLGVLERQHTAEERARSRARWAMPLAATAAGVLAVTGVLGWDGLQDDTAAPARIVQVQPHQQRSMEDLVRWTLEFEGRPGNRHLTLSAAPGRRSRLGAGAPRSSLPAQQEFAAGVAPQGADGLSVQPVSTAAGPSPAPPNVIEWPVQSALPARDPFDRTRPLFRLERRLIPTEAVSYPLHN